MAGHAHAHTHASVHVHTSECTRMHTFPCTCAHAFLHTTRPNHLKHLDSKCTCAQDCPGAGANTISLRRVAYSCIACLAALYIQKSSCLNECTCHTRLICFFSAAWPRHADKPTAAPSPGSQAIKAMQCLAKHSRRTLCCCMETLLYIFNCRLVQSSTRQTSRRGADVLNPRHTRRNRSGRVEEKAAVRKVDPLETRPIVEEGLVSLCFAAHVGA